MNFVITVYDNDTHEEFDFTVTEEWLSRFYHYYEDFNEIMRFLEEYWHENNCEIYVGDVDEEDE